MKYHKGLLKSYIIGFLLSIILTLAAYFPVEMHVNANHKVYSHITLIVFIVILAFIQMIIQLLFFLHLGQEEKPRWKSFMFVSFISIVLIVVVASIWIMTHLNYNMSLMQFNNLMKYGEGF
jgi:cytochrome o ubiquinol oxidase operon protein cyoD